jgi:hypothetical protein
VFSVFALQQPAAILKNEKEKSKLFDQTSSVLVIGCQKSGVRSFCGALRQRERKTSTNIEHHAQPPIFGSATAADLP